MDQSRNKDAKWMSIGEAAEYLGVSRDTLRRWEKKGKIQAVRSPTNRRYYTQKQLKQIMEGKEAEKKTWPKKASAQGPKISPPAKLALVGIISFLVTALIAFLVRFFLF